METFQIVVRQGEAALKRPRTRSAPRPVQSSAGRGDSPSPRERSPPGASMNRHSPFVALTAAAFLLVGCGDQPTAPGGIRRPPPPPAFAIFDGAHNGGNPGFFFLPPLVAN